MIDKGKCSAIALPRAQPALMSSCCSNYN